MNLCPSDLELEALLRRPGREPPHLAACPRCAARVAEMRRLGDEFEREVFPATVDAVVERALRPARPRHMVWLVPLAAVAAAAVLVLVRRAGPPEDYLGVKGPPMTLVVYAAAPGGARPVAENEVVPADARLRFEVRTSRACNLWIVSTDAAGQVSRIYPPSGASGAKVASGSTVAVPGGAVLDGHPGPERFFALCGCGDDPLELSDVERAARAVGPGEARVRGARELPGLPADTLQATVLVEKRP